MGDPPDRRADEEARRAAEDERDGSGRLAPRTREAAFRRVGPGEYRTTEVAIRPRSPVEWLWRGFKRILVGAPLATSQLLEQRLSKVKALAVFASNNLSSSAYATAELLLIL